MRTVASDLSQRLARQAHAVCRYYLSKGHREGAYWLVGDVHNTPGRSLFVRLVGPETGPGAAGHWRDAATGQHGDLLDLLGLVLGRERLVEAFDEARRFLALPPQPWLPEPSGREPAAPRSAARSQMAARRLFAKSQSLIGTPAEAYLHARALAPLPLYDALRFHPRCYYRPSRDDAPDIATAWPALIASVTDLQGRQTGAHRTWLDRHAARKAPIATPRRAMGALLGHGVRLGAPQSVLAAGEGLETVLSVAVVAPTLPLVAALSSAHLAALLLQPGLRRLYLLVDPDRAGHAAAEALAQRASSAEIEALFLQPTQGDFNDDLRRMGPAALAAHLAPQFAPEDRPRFLQAT